MARAEHGRARLAAHFERVRAREVDEEAVVLDQVRAERRLGQCRVGDAGDERVVREGAPVVGAGGTQGIDERHSVEHIGV